MMRWTDMHERVDDYPNARRLLSLSRIKRRFMEGHQLYFPLYIQRDFETIADV